MRRKFDRSPTRLALQSEDMLKQDDRVVLIPTICRIAVVMPETLISTRQQRLQLGVLLEDWDGAEMWWSPQAPRVDIRENTVVCSLSPDPAHG